MRRLSFKCFPWLALLLALVCLWNAVTSLRDHLWFGFIYAGLVVAPTILFALAAAAVQFRWRVRPLFAFLSGLALLLYAASVLFLGREDAGGAMVAVPLALVTAAIGVMGFVAAGKYPGTSPPNKSLERTREK